MFSSINSKSAALKSTTSSIQVIIDSNSVKKTTCSHLSRSTESHDELARPPSPLISRGPRVISFNPKVFIRTAPRYHCTNRPLPTITEWTISSPSSKKLILAQRTVSGGDIEYTVGTRIGDTVVEDVERRHLADILDHVTEADLRAFDSKELKEWAVAKEAATQAEIIELQRRRGGQNHPGQSRKLGRPPGSKKSGRPKKDRASQNSSAILTLIDRAVILTSRTERRFQRHGTTTVEEAFVALPQVQKRINRAQLDISTGTSTNASSRLQSLAAENATNSDNPDTSLKMLSHTSESSNVSQATQPASPSESRAQSRGHSPLLPPVPKVRPDVVYRGDDKEEEEDATQIPRQFQAPTRSIWANGKGKRNRANDELNVLPTPPTLHPDNQILHPKESNASLQVNHTKSLHLPTAGVKFKMHSCTSLTPLYPSNYAPSIPRRRPSPIPSLSPPGKKPKTSISHISNATPPQRESTQQASPLNYTPNQRFSTSTTTCDSTRRSSRTLLNPPTVPATATNHLAAAGLSTTSTPAATAAQDGTEPDLFIDAILDHRVIQQGSKRQIEYLIKWEGFPVEQAEWHEADALVDSEDIIKAYTVKRAGVGGKLRAKVVRC